MEIAWLGYSAFRIKGKETVLITDPFPWGTGAPEKAEDSSRKEDKSGLVANIVTISHNHYHHNYAKGVAGKPIIINGPGEYEVADTFFWGYPSYHDNEEGKKLGKNTVYLIQWEELTLCHLGDIGHIPGPQLASKLTNIDILMLPAGSGSTLKASVAAQVVRLLEPKIIIPMHFKALEAASKMEGSSPDSDTVDKFLAEMGSRDTIPQPRFNISRSSLPDKAKVVLLTARGKLA